MKHDNLIKLMPEIRRAQGWSLTDLGEILAAQSCRGKPYDRSYVKHMETGRNAISDRVAEVLLDLAMQAGVDLAITGGLHPYQLPLQTLVQHPVAICANPACGRHFIPRGRARYCSPECRRKGRSKTNAGR